MGRQVERDDPPSEHKVDAEIGRAAPDRVLRLGDVAVRLLANMFILN
jgi:hypothetical protein